MKTRNALTPFFVVLISFLWMVGCGKDNLTSPEVNHPPVITSFFAFPTNNIDGGETSVLKLVASDPDNDDLSVNWIATGGVFLSTTNDSAVWQAPDSSGTFTCTATVSDGKATVDSSVSINVTYGLKFVGRWSGSTSQNYPISFTVENVGGYVGVAGIGYKINVQGAVLIEGTSGFIPPREIANGKFNISGYHLYVDGIFSDMTTLLGDLSARPESIAVWDTVTYSAKKL